MWLYIKVVWLSGLAESVVSEKGMFDGCSQGEGALILKCDIIFRWSDCPMYPRMFDGGSQGEGALSADTGHPRHPFTTAAEFLLQL